MKTTPDPRLQEAVTRLTRLPKSPTVADFEVVTWDHRTDINGATPEEAVASWLDGNGAPCPDACAVLLREKRSGLVFLVQYRHPVTNEALRDPVALAETTRWICTEKLPAAPSMDAGAPAMALISRACARAGLSPAEGMQALSAIFGRTRGYDGPEAVPVPDPASQESGPAAAAATVARRPRGEFAVNDEQPAPRSGYGDMWRQLIDRLAAKGQIDESTVELMEDRRQLGIERYGTPLQAGNGRDVLADMAQELLDALVYSEQVGEERPDLIATIRGEWQTGLLILLERVLQAR